MTPILREAAEYLSEHGWVQGRAFRDGALQDFADAGGRDEWIKATKPAACAIGAILAVQVINGYKHVDAANAEQVLEQSLNLGHMGYLVTWNDDPERTAEDVILAMKRAAGL